MPNGQPRNFFALVENDEGEIEVRRLMLRREAQEALEAIFRESRVVFLEEGLEVVPYNGTYKPDDGEILAIDPFDLHPDIVPALREPTQFEPLLFEAEVEPRMKAIFTGDADGNGAEVFFQAFLSSQSLQHRRMTFWQAEEMLHPVENPGFSVRGELHAIYVDGRLLFYSDWWVKRMMDISEHYYEATDEDLDDFVAHPAVYVSDDEQFFDNADTWVRKRVALINSRGILEDYTPAMIRDRARDLEITIDVREEDGRERLVLPEVKSDLKETLRFLNEDMFAGPITEDRFISSSKRRADN